MTRRTRSPGGERRVERVTYRERVDYSNSESGIEVPISLTVGTSTVRLLAKVDTGAKFCVFQREYAEALGLEVETGTPQTMSTATGSFRSYGHTVTVKCFDWSYDAVVYFAAQPDFPRNVVGRYGWLQNLRVGIVDHDSLLLLSHYNE